jgi:hypothetical protein
MVHSTFRTFPLSNIQRHLIYDMPTIPAPFSTWKPVLYLNQLSPIPLTFVSELSNQFTPTSIANRKREFMVLDHIFDSQILNYDRLVFTNQLSYQLNSSAFRADFLCLCEDAIASLEVARQFGQTVMMISVGWLPPQLFQPVDRINCLLTINIIASRTS